MGKQEENANGATALLSSPRLRFRYPEAFSDWSLDVEPFVIRPRFSYSLRGPNMSGKTTLLRLLTGHLEPATPVEILFKGSPFSLPAGAASLRASGLAISHQNDRMFPPLSIWDNVRAGCPDRATYRLRINTARDLCASLLSAIGVNGTNFFERPLQSLSGGGSALVRLARAIAWGYDLLLLDEPTSNLDHENRAKYFQNLFRTRPQDSTVILISHYDDDHEALRQLSDGRYSYTTLYLDQGRLTENGGTNAERA